MVNFIEPAKKMESYNHCKHSKLRDTKSEVIQNHVKEMKNVVKTLEASVTESDLDDQRLVRQLHIDHSKNQRITTQLEEARKENKQLLNILQQNCHEKELSRDLSRSQVDVSSAYSTMSMVNLQYKYEELLSNYEGLLKMLATKEKDVQKCYKENESIRDEMNNISKKFQECERVLRNVCAKYLALKQRKDNRINQLKHEKETLRMAHEQVVILLHQQCMKNDELLAEKLHETLQPERAQFIQEIQRSNKLQHENILLKQEIVRLKSKCPSKNVRFFLKKSTEEKTEKQ